MIRRGLFVLGMVLALPLGAQEPLPASLGAKRVVGGNGVEMTLEWRFAPGDDPARANPDFDDSDWTAVRWGFPWGNVYYVGLIALAIGSSLFTVNTFALTRRRLERNEGEIESARKLQEAMLPKELPAVEGIDVAAWLSTASEVGERRAEGHVAKTVSATEGTQNGRIAPRARRPRTGQRDLRILRSFVGARALG